MRRARAPAARAARYAVRPAVPAPMIATSVFSMVFSLRRFLLQSGEVLLKLVGAADEPAADEHLRRRALAGNRAQRRRRDALAELHFLVDDAFLRQQGLG